jgi:glutathione S-transferase
MEKTLPQYPLIADLYERVKEAPRIKAYLESNKRQKYSMGIFRHYPELDEE